MTHLGSFTSKGVLSGDDRVSGDISVVVHAGYEVVQVALASESGIIDKKIIEKNSANRDFLASLDSLLADKKLSLSRLSFLAVLAGPGPFTTLRVVLSVINGLSYATGLPIVKIDGLEAFLEEQKKLILSKNNFAARYLVVLQNAFCNDVYFAICDLLENKLVRKDCLSIDCFISFIEKMLNASGQNKPEKFVCVGNALLLYEDLLEHSFDNLMLTSEENIQNCSLEYLRIKAYQAANEKLFHKKILPIYLKSVPYSSSSA